MVGFSIPRYRFRCIIMESRGSEVDVASRVLRVLFVEVRPKGPCTQIVYILAPMYLYRDYTFQPMYILYEYMDP